MTASILPSMRAPLRQSFEAKQLQTLAIIAKHIRQCPPEKQAVGFSGGKDSTVVLKYVLGSAKNFLPENDWKKIAVVFENTGVEYPQTVKFVHDLRDLWEFNLIELKPEKTFWQCVSEMKRYPQGKTHRESGFKRDICCDYLKERPMKAFIKSNNIEVIYDGITALESRQRMMRAVSHGTCSFIQDWNVEKVHPILYWKESEVWDFTNVNHIPVNPVYSLGANRCGCMTCTAHKGWKDELSKTNPKMLRKIMRDMGQHQLVAQEAES